MPFRKIEIPAFGRMMSNIMAHPSSSDTETNEPALDEYFRLGGNCIHLHGEGGESHTRRSTGQWLKRRDLRPQFFLCTQICHAGWDESANCPIDRFTAQAVNEDVDVDLELLATGFLDFVYLDDNPHAPFEPVVDAIGRQIARGRVRAFGVRNWDVKRINTAQAYLSRTSQSGMAAVVTTELALATALAPLWPGYVPFDRTLRQAVDASGLTVLAHAADFNLGQCLFSDVDATSSLRQHWVQRWDHPANAALVHRVQNIASAHALTARAVNLAWLLNRPFPCVAIVPLPSLLTTRRCEYERASQLILGEGDQAYLSGDRTPT